MTRSSALPASLDLARYWQVTRINPGTPYPDEPDMDIDPGLYVVGTNGEQDVEGAARHIVRVEESYDWDGNDTTQELADWLCRMLQIAADKTHNGR